MKTKVITDLEGNFIEKPFQFKHKKKDNKSMREMKNFINKEMKKVVEEEKQAFEHLPKVKLKHIL